MGVLNELLHVVSFFVVRKSLVSSISENSYSGIAEISLESGEDWDLVNITAGESKFKEDLIDTERAGIYYKQSFVGLLPSKNVLLPGDLRLLTTEPVICKLVLSNGTVLLLGNLTYPIRLRYGLDTSKSNYAIEFERESQYPAFVLPDNDNPDVIVSPDEIAPVIQLIGDNDIYIIEGYSYSDAGATATDNIDGDITANIVATNNVDVNTPGTYVITYNVNDSSGNDADEVQRTVVVTAKQFLLTWDDISTIPVNDVNSVSEWNTFFDLPAQGSIFTEVAVSDDTVNLVGGSGIYLKDELFNGITGDLVRIDDIIGCVTGIGYNVFTADYSLVFVKLSSVTEVNGGAFMQCPNIEELYLNSLINMGITVGDDLVFYNTLTANITLTIPSALMTCNGGNPDGDIQYLQANNTVTIVEV